ncbi:hypothetical protein SAMN05216178_6955 [Pseudomonas saponiphila]|jgi:hypothetical protein|uniref:Uncharacterized protein n=1 Tax=Pseudomonas saponiphila TaxID=556534 RepID=A0A1H5A457_9PSED|nr:hypothetical protein [Pseudomonas saponiphila]SED36564.1 hypothetical protein SAMN05216178_6955 [Pseudomonas saponiphila]
MIITLQAENPETGDKASYQMGARNSAAARDAFRHYLRGRGWTEAQISAAKIEQAPVALGAAAVCA